MASLEQHPQDVNFKVLFMPCQGVNLLSQSPSMLKPWGSSLFPISHGKEVQGELKEEELLQTERVALDGVVWKMIDRRILPLCFIIFLLDSADRGNISNARLAGLQKSLTLSNFQFTMILTVTYVSVLAVELPSNLLLKYVGPDRMLPVMTTLWGIVSALQGLVSNYSGLLACRLFLGVLQGGAVPGIILYLSMFYPRKKLQIRIAIFYTSVSLAGAFSGLLAAAIDQMNGLGNKPGWAWIFILEGLASVVFGALLFFLLPRSPEKVPFFTEEEKRYFIYSLKSAGSMSVDHKWDNFSWREIIRAMTSLHALLLIPVFFNSGAILFAIAYFEPTVVASLGYAGTHAQLMSVPPYAVAFVLLLTSAIVSDHYQCRGYTLIFSSLLQLMGFSMFYLSKSSHVRYASLFFFVPGTLCAIPAMITWLANNSAPHIRRATSIAMTLIITQLGGILSTWFLGFISAGPNYTSATIMFIVMSICMVVFSAANLLYLWRENRLKAERRQRTKEEDESKNLGDRSAWFIYSL